jgi:hypothetical protein
VAASAHGAALGGERDRHARRSDRPATGPARGRCRAAVRGRNPARLRVLAAVALVVAIVPGLLSSLATVLTLEHLGASGPPLGFRILELSLSPFFLAATLLVVAEVFKHGQSLTDDVEGLV